MQKQTSEIDAKHQSVVKYAKENGSSQAAITMNAIRHSYSEENIRKILDAAGVKKRGVKVGVKDTTLRIVAMMQDGMMQADVARKLQVTRAFVSAVVKRARDAGIRVDG